MTSLLDAPPACPPRFLHLPQSRSSAGREAIELAEIAGLFLYPWQQDVLMGALGERDDGKWSAFEVGLVVGRQNGKGAILEALELAHAVLFGSQEIIHTAHLDKTAKNHFQRMVRLVEGTPEIAAKVEAIRYSNGDRGIKFKNGANISFSTRAKEGGRGLSGDLVVIDEAMRLKGLGDLLPTLSARPNPQIWYTSSAPIIGPESDVLRRICARGRGGASTMAYFEWSMPHDVDPDDRAAWWAANPSMGYRLTEEFTEAERASMTDDEFRRERLGAWNPDEAQPKEIPESAWKAVQDPLAVPSDPMAFAVEMTPDRMAASIVAAGADPDGVPVIVTVEHRERDLAPKWLVPALTKLWQRDPRAVVIDPKSAAGTLIDDLELAGVTVTKCDLRDHIAAQAALFDAILGGEVKVRPAEPLDAAVATAARRDVGGSWLWKSNPVTPATPLVAAGMALWGFTQPAPPTRRAVSQIG